MDNQHQVFEFGGKTFAAGLFWQTVASEKGWKSEARAQAQFQFKDMDLCSFCKLKDPFGVPQVGYASIEGGAKPGAISIAAAVAKAVAKRHNYSSWIGIFPVEGEFYIFVAVIKDALLPEGDCAGGKSDVLERFGQEFGQTNQWEAIYAPKSFQIGNAQDLPLEDILDFSGGKLKVANPCRLEPIKSALTLPKVAAAVGVLAVSSALTYYLLTTDNPLEDLPKPEQFSDVVQNEKPPIILPLPWKTMPEPAQVALMCLEASQRLPIAPGGWGLENFECTQSAVNMAWQRDGSNLAFIRTVMNGIVFDDNADKATFTLPRQLPMPYEGEAVSVMEQGKLALISFVQGTGLQASYTYSPESTTKDDKGQVTIKSWKNLTFSLTGVIAPWDFVTMVSHIHGLRLHKATRTGDQWKLEGDIYGK